MTKNNNTTTTEKPDKFYVCQECIKGFCLRRIEEGQELEDCTYNQQATANWKQISKPVYVELVNKLRKEVAK